MTKLKKLMMVVASIMIAVGLPLTAFGAYSVAGETTNYVSTAQFGSKIVEEYNPPEYVQPGAYVEKRVNIKNLGEASALVRVQLIREFDKAELDPEMILLDVDTKNWVEKDGWYYYKHILKGGEETSHPVLKGFTLSNEAGDEYKSTDGHIRVIAESIQYDGGFVKEAWGISYDELEVSEPNDKQKSETTKVTYTGSTFQFNYKNKDDLFVNFKKLIPGQTRTQVILVENASNQSEKIDLTYMFSKDTDQMLKDLMFRFVRVELKDLDGKVLYSGFIGGEDSDKNIPLGEFKAGEVKKFIVSAVVDAGLNAEYAGLKGSVDWGFAVHEHERVNASQPNSPSYFAKTGDSNFVLYLGAGSVIVGCIMLYYAIRKKKGVTV